MKRFALLLAILASTIQAFGSANASGKLTNPDTTGAVPGYAQFTLYNCGGNFPQVAGSAILSTQQFTLNADGTWSGILDRNDEITCNGTNSTWWRLQYFVGGRQIGVARDFVCSQASCVFDGTGALTPITTYPAPPPPSPPLISLQPKVCPFTLATTWTCTHNFGVQPVVAQLYDSNWHEIMSDTPPTATDVNTETAVFLQPQSGYMIVLYAGNSILSTANPNFFLLNPNSDQSLIGDHALSLGGSLSAKRPFKFSSCDNVAFGNTAACQADAGTTGGMLFPPGYTIGTFTNSNNVPVLDLTRMNWSGAWKLTDFGCKGDGTTDDSACVLSAITTVCSSTFTARPLTGAGLSYAIGSTVTIPACSGLAVRDAKFLPTSGFTSGYLAQTTTTNRLANGFSLEEAELYNVEFDGSASGSSTHKADGFLCNYCLKVNILNSRFYHYPAHGLYLAVDGHDNVVANNKFFEYRWNDINYNVGPWTAVSLQSDIHDSSFVNNIGGYGKTGEEINASYDTSIGEHWYGFNNAGWYITQNAAFTNLIGPYIDSNSIIWENPWNSSIISAKALTNSAGTFPLKNGAFLNLKAMASGITITGFRVSGSFQDQAASTTAEVFLDTSSGTFNAGQILDTDLDTQVSLINVSRFTAWDQGRDLVESWPPVTAPLAGFGKIGYDTSHNLRCENASLKCNILVDAYQTTSGGAFWLNNPFAITTAPTISSGFGTSPSILSFNGTKTFRINVGTGGTANSGIVGLSSGATSGYNCTAYNLTSHAGNRADDTVVTASSANTVTVQNQTKSTGAAAAWTANDTVVVNCDAY